MNIHSHYRSWQMSGGLWWYQVTHVVILIFVWFISICFNWMTMVKTNEVSIDQVPSRFSLDMKVCMDLFWFGGYGHERPWPFRLGQVKDNFVSVYPLWTYSENILEISHDSVNKWKFISICFYWVAIAIIDHSHSG